jgi:hypothetical protein
MISPTFDVSSRKDPLTLCFLDNSFEVFPSMTELADSHAGTIVIEQALCSLLEHRSGKWRWSSSEVVHLGTV